MGDPSPTRSLADKRAGILDSLQISFQGSPRFIGGLALATLLAVASLWLSDFIGKTILGFSSSPISSVTIAILLGLVVGNLIPQTATLQPGIAFAVKRLLRLGIILLGLRLSIVEVLQLGLVGLPIVMVGIVTALLLSTRLSRQLQLPQRLGALISVGTAICGVSAIVATAPVIRAKDEEVVYAATTITFLGMIATLTYPYLARVLFGANPVMAGLFFGTAVQDTSQVAGAALVYSQLFALPHALDVATLTKLIRNLFMIVVIPYMSLSYLRQTNSDSGHVQRATWAQVLPLFVVAFVCMAIVRSLGDLGLSISGYAYGLGDRSLWTAILSQAQLWAFNLLTVALAGVGLSANLNKVKNMGAKPFLAGVAIALALGVASFVSIHLLSLLVAL